MKFFKFFLVIFLLIPQLAQAIYRVYTGNIGDRKVEFYIYAIPDSTFNIRYIDDKTFKIKQLGLPEKKRNNYIFKEYSGDSEGDVNSILIKNFDFNENKANSENKILKGYSTEFGEFTLEKKFEYNVVWDDEDKNIQNQAQSLFNNVEFDNIEFLQVDSTDNFYFKVLISKKKKDDIRIKGINIYSKKNGELYQTILNSKGYRFYTFSALSIGDFDFDGIKDDLSLADGETSGVNVPHKYYLYDKSSEKFVDANLEGYIFDFDNDKKIATSTKTCDDLTKDSTSITLNKMYFLMKKQQKFQYLENYCLVSSDEFIRKCTSKEKQSCENKIVKPTDDL